MTMTNEAEAAAALEVAWRDGFQTARECLTDDEAFCLTEDVEDDAWADSSTRALLQQQAQAEETTDHLCPVAIELPGPVAPSGRLSGEKG